MHAHTKIFDKLSFLSLLLVLVLLPVFCLPFTNFPIETSKGLLLVVGLTISVIFWTIARFVDGKISFPKSWLIKSGWIVVLVTLISAIFSSSANREMSLFGLMFDVGSFWFIFTAFTLLFMTAVIFRTAKQSKTLLLGAILSSAFVLIFQAVYIFIPTHLSLGILVGKTGNLLGSWNAFGLYAGFSCLMFLLVSEFFPVSKIEKIFLNILILLSIFLAACVNFSLVWILLGISSLIIFVYKISISMQSSEEEKKRFPLVAFVTMIIALLFVISGQFVGNLLPNLLHISNTEVVPSLSSTMSVAKDVLTKPHTTLLGIGPNRFMEAWAMYKPLSINNTQFWNVAFDYGAGLFPTFFATTGILGILSWVMFLVMFLYIGIKSVFSRIKDEVNWEMMAFFILSLYLFISSFFYYTGVVLFLLALAFTGVFAGLVSTDAGKEVTITFSNNHRKGFFSVLSLIIIVMFVVTVSFKYVERFISVAYFGSTLSAQSVSSAETSINKALNLYVNDLYLRTYSQVYLIDSNTLASKSATLSEADKAALSTSVNNTLNSAVLATKYNPGNYLNFQTLGSMYQATGDYNDAITAYQSAAALNPLDPSIKLSLAGASFLNGKVADAKDFANQALSLKPDYVDALVTLSQIAKSEGNYSEALADAKKALDITPDDTSLSQYVNSLSTPSTPATNTSTVPSTTKNKK